MKEGDKVVCIKPKGKPWDHPLKGEHFNGPYDGDILTVDAVRYRPDYFGHYLLFIEWPGALWHMKYFRPVDYSTGEKIAEVLEESFNQQPVEV